MSSTIRFGREPDECERFWGDRAQWWETEHAEAQYRCAQESIDIVLSAHRRESPRRQEAIDVLNVKLQLNALARQVHALSRRVSELESFPRPLTVPINTFAPKPFEVIRPIIVLVEPVVDEGGEPCEYIASFPDGAISVTGDTIEEAVLLLKDRMAAQYSRLTRLSADRMGRIPQQQLDALQSVMRRSE